MRGKAVLASVGGDKKKRIATLKFEKGAVVARAARRRTSAQYTRERIRAAANIAKRYASVRPLRYR